MFNDAASEDGGAVKRWRGDGGGDAICRNFPLAPLIICRPLHKADKFHTKSYLAK